MKLSKVAIVRGRGVLSSGSMIDQKKLIQMYTRGFQILTEQSSLRESVSVFFRPRERIGIKINTIAGRKLTSRPEATICLSNILSENGIQGKNIIIWDRTNRELREAGYRLNLSGAGVKIFGTDTDGAGYNSGLISHLNIGSIFSSIQSELITASISFAVLKDHGLAGVTAGMKNYFGTIHNPNKYHDDNCNPFIPELFDSKFIKRKHKLSILDCLIVQYHRGPSFHSPWAKRYEALIFSSDPVAADFVGWQIIEKLRAEKGLPSLKEENREPQYFITAEKMGLGRAQSKFIQIIEEEV
ncbi:MAG: DUF362 domain-containing protein [Candidatus Aminicenantaceae bacterium]